MNMIKINTAQNVDLEYPVAGVGERIGAYLLDGLIFFATYIVFLLGGLALNKVIPGLNNFLTYLFFAIYIFTIFFYHLACEIFNNGQSIGKKIVKIKVVSLTGTRPTIGQYLIRWLFRLVDFSLTMGLGALITVLASKNKQRIGDIVAGTTLIKTQPQVNYHHIAFQAPIEEDYQITFDSAHLLKDADVELIHEVVQTYNATGNQALIQQMAERTSKTLEAAIPDDMDQLEFLKKVVADYSHLTSQV